MRHREAWSNFKESIVLFGRPERRENWSNNRAIILRRYPPPASFPEQGWRNVRPRARVQNLHVITPPVTQRTELIIARPRFCALAYFDTRYIYIYICTRGVLRKLDRITRASPRGHGAESQTCRDHERSTAFLASVVAPKLFSFVPRRRRL